MRHRKHHGSLGLVTGHRRALLANLATALIREGRISTTHAKARAMRSYVEKLITLGKRGDLHARRQALAKLRYRPIVDRLFNEVAPGYAERTGGYTRIIKTGFRAGDAAPMAIIELVEPGKVETKVRAKPKKTKPVAQPPAPKAEEKAEAGETPVEEKTAGTVAEAQGEAERPQAETKAEPEEKPEEKAGAEEDVGEAKAEAGTEETKAEDADKKES